MLVKAKFELHPLLCVFLNKTDHCEGGGEAGEKPENIFWPKHVYELPSALKIAKNLNLIEITSKYDLLELNGFVSAIGKALKI